MAAISRREFIRGRFRNTPAVLRPPWAVAEDVFTSVCTRCDTCLGACPGGILKRGAGGFPTVDFSHGECTFCGECVVACPSPALDRQAWTRGGPAWNLVVNIGQACLPANKVVCRSCGDACEPRAIVFRLAPGGLSLPELVGTACNGCGACVAICPASAITLTPEQTTAAKAA